MGGLPSFPGRNVLFYEENARVGFWGGEGGNPPNVPGKRERQRARLRPERLRGPHITRAQATVACSPATEPKPACIV